MPVTIETFTTFLTFANAHDALCESTARLRFEGAAVWLECEGCHAGLLLPFRNAQDVDDFARVMQRGAARIRKPRGSFP